MQRHGSGSCPAFKLLLYLSERFIYKMESASSTMTDNLMLSLRASPKSDPDKSSLPFLISRINEQRGSFRSVTEDSLQEGIRGLEAGQAEAVEDSGDDEEAHDDRPRREQLASAREEMLRQVTYEGPKE